MPSRHFSFFLVLFSLLFSTLASAGGTKASTVVEIKSDFASYEQLNRRATHTGNVIMKQDNHLLAADKLIIQKDTNGAPQEITATGTPATFQGLLGSKDPIKASAKVIHYYPARHLIVLEGEATLLHQKDKFHGPTLSYQIDKQIVSASKSELQRPTIIFHPQVSSVTQ